MLPVAIVRQVPATAESRAVAQAAMLRDVPCAGATLEELASHQASLRSGAVAVGSVEFVREAMRLAGISEPTNISYPKPLESLLRRKLRQMPAGKVLGTWFVKPVTTKAFTGFVFDTMAAPEVHSEHDREQYEAFMALPPDTPVWVSEPVKFVSEWRYYVQSGSVVGRARYDPDGADDAAMPSLSVLAEALAAMSADPLCPAAYALDLGVLEAGETALVEVNDAWALGLYGRGVDPVDYLAMLASRWQEIRAPGATLAFASAPATGAPQRFSRRPT